MMMRGSFACLVALVTLSAACAVPIDDAIDDAVDEIVDGDPDDASDDESVASTSDALTSTQKTSARNDIITHGERHLRAPYEFGASPSSTRTFDCSSFVKHLFASEAGMTLPRTAKQQSQRGRPVSLSNLRKGDVVFFKSTSRPVDVDHVGIYAGSDRILHTYRVGVGVTYSSFAANSYWRKHAVLARDFIGR